MKFKSTFTNLVKVQNTKNFRNILKKLNYIQIAYFEKRVKNFKNIFRL